MMSLIRGVCCAVGVAIVFSAVPSFAAKGYKCKGSRSGTTYAVTLKKGKARAGGGTFATTIKGDGAISFEVAGEDFVLAPKGIVQGRGGRKVGKHNCDLKKAAAALKK